jgi:hypothetical protein
MPLVAVAIIVVAATAIFTLFIRAKDLPQADPVSPTQHLDERKAAIYENLRDLQFEYRVGKLSDTDYQLTKVTLQKELAVVLADIERIIAGSPKSEKTDPEAKAAPKPKVAPGVECPHCGASFPKPMKFCGECGKAMA